MSYRTDRLRHRLADREGETRMVWDVPGQTGYEDLMEERVEGIGSGPSLDFSSGDNRQYVPVL